MGRVKYSDQPTQCCSQPCDGKLDVNVADLKGINKTNMFLQVHVLLYDNDEERGGIIIVK